MLEFLFSTTTTQLQSRLERQNEEGEGKKEKLMQQLNNTQQQALQKHQLQQQNIQAVCSH